MIDEGVVKYRSDWTRSAPLDYKEIDELNRWRRPLFDAGMIGHWDEQDIGYGNLSVRIDASDRFIISGTQTGHVAMTDARHYALVTGFDIERNSVHCVGPVQASSEAMTHAALYGLDAQIGAVVHVHRDELWVRLKDRVATAAASAAYGTPGLAREFARLYRETDLPESGIAVMAGHDAGLISIGRTVREAAERILTQEALR